MFEYIKLKNFKSFGNIEFNLSDRKGIPKNLILVYGENGIGKSNLASAFFMLSETLRTMNVRDIMQTILLEDPESFQDEDFAKYIKMRYKDIETLIKENKTVSSTENMYLEFGFNLNGKSGRYIIETNDSQIVHEHLEYVLIRNRGVYFDITPDSISINEKIFAEKEALNDLKTSCNKFWGKHSFLSILEHECDDKADSYLRNQLSSHFKKLMQFFSNLSCKVKYGSKQERGIIGLPHNILGDYYEGKIDIKDENLLSKTEKMLNAFFMATYKDVKRVYFKKEKKDNFIHYSLMITKLIAGQERDLDFSLESTGTQSLLQLLPFMLVVVKGSTVIIDEFDTGIHDLLVQNLVTSLNEHLEGQLIMTTHNTLLMESAPVLPKDCIYVINELKQGEKEIQCITHYDNKIHRNTNIRDQYLLGQYHGIPEKASINFHSLLETLN